jgi:hypothetical protein
MCKGPEKEMGMARLYEPWLELELFRCEEKLVHASSFLGESSMGGEA